MHTPVICLHSRPRFIVSTYAFDDVVGVTLIIVDTMVGHLTARIGKKSSKAHLVCASFACVHHNKLISRTTGTVIWTWVPVSIQHRQGLARQEWCQDGPCHCLLLMVRQVQCWSFFYLRCRSLRGFTSMTPYYIDH